MAAAGDDKVKLIVSYGGEIRRCPVSGAARYVGGENRLVKVGMSERLADLRARLAALAGYGAAVRLRYVEDGLDAPLRDVDGDGDLWRLVTLLYFRSAGVAPGERCRVRAFLFPVDDAAPLASSSPAVCLRQSASSPALVSPANNMGRRNVAATSLLRAQSAGPLHVAGSSPATTTSAESTTRLERADSGFEALAAIAEEQSRPPSSSAKNNTGRVVTSPSLLRAQSAGPLRVVAGSSSATTTGETTTKPLQRADSGFEALAAIAAEQSRPPSSSATTSSGGCAGQAGSGLEAAVAAEQKLPPERECPAPVVLVPVVAPVVAVFYPVIPVYQCVVLAGVALHGRCESLKGGSTIMM